MLETSFQEPIVKPARRDLEAMIEKFSQRPGIKLAAVEMGIPETILERSLQSFKGSLSNSSYISKRPLLPKLLGDIMAGSAHVDDLFPYFLSHARQKYPAVTVVPQLQEISNLTQPHMWYTRARSFKRRFVFHAGPTNSGKTHSALQRFLKAHSAIYCAPLRMLAHEIYHRSNARGTPCDLLTGEERQLASGSVDAPSSHMSCTVEMADLESYYDVAVVDEVQMIADIERGGAWTRAILGLPAEEIHLCGHESALPLVRRLVHTMGDQLEVCRYERLSPLVPLDYSLEGDFKNITDGDCVVVFSRTKLYQVRKKIESATNKPCAVIYGGLPSATRVQQARLFNDRDSPCQIMVATDAIGMGLNLNIRRIVMYDLYKFDGREHRQLTSAHLKQITGRAGRYGHDFSQGEVTTFYAEDLDELHSLLSSPEDSIEQAGINPTVEQIEHFSHLLPGASFLDILALFFKMAQIDGNFFLCKVEPQLGVARWLKGLPLSLRDMYKMTLAPVEKENGPKVLKEFATHYSCGKCVTYSRLCEIVGWPRRAPLSPVQLIMFEQVHEAVDLYLWLCMRFPEFFVAADEARELQRTIEKEIARYLGKHLQRVPDQPRVRLRNTAHKRHHTKKRKHSYIV
jgi:ATP-dependent RNA helicase SUPV3L1/SUV3